MRYLDSKLAIVVLGVGLVLTLAGPPASAAPPLEAYGKLPLQFQPAAGQTDPQVKFLARNPGHSLFLTPTEAVIVLRKGGSTGSPESSAGQGQKSAVVRMQFVGANAATKIVGLDELPGKVNYFRGNDPARWRRNIPTYARVAYRQLYPGIDLVLYGNERQLEYDLVVAPGADPGAIALQFAGTETVKVDANGDLVLKVSEGEVRWRKPVIYQEVDEIQTSVAGEYVLRGGSRVGFRVAAYDASRPLVIDPVLAYSTYLGGSNREYAGGIAVDSAGDAYIAGTTQSADFPTANSLQGPSEGPGPGVNDAFVAKLNAAGSALVYSTYLGGSSYEGGSAIAVDAAGNAYVTGATDSADFPTANPIQACGRGGDIFVTKLDAAGSALVYSTCLGGSGRDGARAIALDAEGNAYLTGTTSSTDFPTVNPIQAVPHVSENSCWRDMSGVQHCRFSEAFVAKLNAAGSALVYSTYLGGSGNDHGSGIAVDGEGNAYVTGVTASTDFPTVNPIQAAWAGGNASIAPGYEYDAFVTKVNAAGSALVYSTYLGGSGTELQSAIAVDSSGNAYVTGYTRSADFPTANAIQADFGGGWSDAFVTKLNAAGSALVYSTYLGGSDFDAAWAIAVDRAGNAYVAGATHSTDFPTANPSQASLADVGDTCTMDVYGAWHCHNPGLSDAFVTKLDPTGSALLYSTYLGGSGYDAAWAIALDEAGSVYLLGESASKDFPTVNPIQATRAGGLQGDGVTEDVDAFVAKIPSDPSTAL